MQNRGDVLMYLLTIELGGKRTHVVGNGMLKDTANQLKELGYDVETIRNGYMTETRELVEPNGFDGLEYRIVYKLNGERMVETLFAHNGHHAMQRLVPHLLKYEYINQDDVPKIEILYSEII